MPLLDLARYAPILAAGALACTGCVGQRAVSTPPAAAIASPAPARSLVFLHDDFPAARALAAAKNLPLVVEASGPWCNSCTFMKAALHSPALAGYADRFVWLELDLDAPANSAFLLEHPIQSLPALFVLDPRGAVTATWLGSASERELAAFLDLATRPAAGRPAEALRIGDARFEAGDWAGAARAYVESIRAGGEAWPGRDHAEEQLANALQLSDPAACVTMADATAPHMARGRAFVNVTLSGLGCSQAPAVRADPAAVARLERLAEEALALDAAEEDDRFGLFGTLMAVRASAGDTVGRERYARRFLSYVESLPVSTDPELRAARDWGRLRAAAALGDTSPVLAELEATERAQPESSAGSQRLAAAYLGAKRYADARAACTRALSKHPGAQNRATLLLLRFRAETAMGDVEAARNDLLGARAAEGQATASARRFVPGTRESIDKLLESLANEPRRSPAPPPPT